MTNGNSLLNISKSQIKNHLYQYWSEILELPVEEITRCIEGIRQKQVQSEQIMHERYDKTSKSKDVMLEAKNRRIAKLEEENRRLRSELELLWGMFYDRK